MEFWINAAVGAVTGIITGFGIGGGTLLVLYLTLFTKTALGAAQGINLFYFIPTAGSALVSHIKNKRIVWRAVIFSGGAGVVTAICAALVAGAVDVSVLRRVFGAFLMAVGVSELFAKKN